MMKLVVPMAMGMVLGVTMAVTAINSYETAANWSKRSDDYRNGYAAGAADSVRGFADDLARYPLETNRDWTRAAAQCLDQRYQQVSAARAALDAAVADSVGQGKGDLIPASMLDRLAITCK